MTVGPKNSTIVCDTWTRPENHIRTAKLFFRTKDHLWFIRAILFYLNVKIWRYSLLYCYPIVLCIILLCLNTLGLIWVRHFCVVLCQDKRLHSSADPYTLQDCVQESRKCSMLQLSEGPAASGRDTRAHRTHPVCHWLTTSRIVPPPPLHSSTFSDLSVNTLHTVLKAQWCFSSSSGGLLDWSTALLLLTFWLEREVCFTALVGCLYFLFCLFFLFVLSVNVVGWFGDSSVYLTHSTSSW